jgi:hypothetical protein
VHRALELRYTLPGDVAYPEGRRLFSGEDEESLVERSHSRRSSVQKFSSSHTLEVLLSWTMAR